jgi:ParB-like chromosome segregation protein Spo0J
MDKIHPDLESCAVPIDSVQPHPRNVHHGNVPKIARSLDKYGQYKTIVVQKSTGHVCAGNHTWKAAKNLLNWDRIAVVQMDLDDATALKLALMDNRSGADGEDDQQALAALLQEFGDDLDGTGYTPEELTELLDSLDDSEPMPEPGDAPTDDLQQAWGVIVTCGTEEQQLDLLQKLGDEGLNVRALMN